MYSQDRNKLIRAAVKEKWDKYSKKREEFESITGNPQNHNMEKAWKAREYTHAMESEESILGDIRIALASMLSFPTPENTDFWEKHFIRCAVSILECSPGGPEIAHHMIETFHDELERLPSTMDFRRETEPKSEDDISSLLKLINDVITSAGFTISLETSNRQYQEEERDNKSRLLLDQNRYSNRFPSSSVASPNPIGYPSSLTSPNNEEVPIEIVIPFSRVVAPKANYLVKSTGIMKE